MRLAGVKKSHPTDEAIADDRYINIIIEYSKYIKTNTSSLYCLDGVAQ